jgi:hypothetical protein
MRPRLESSDEELLFATRDLRTIELCQHAHDGARCIRDKGHDGAHELLSVRNGLIVEPR